MHKTVLRSALCALPLTLALGACVAQETYDQAELSAKHYQNQTIRKEAEVARLEDENRRLRAQLDAAQIGVTDASYTDDIDARLKKLRETMASLGQNPEDANKFSVEGGYVWRLKNAVVFDLGSSSLSKEGQALLMEVASDINSKPHGAVFVRGHTDSLPVKRAATLAKFPLGNLQLSAERAVEVGHFLTSKGAVSSADVVVMGFGPNEPVAANDTEDNRQKNRRVDIFVSDPQ